MNRTTLIFCFVLFIVGLGSTVAHGQRAPRVPYVDKGACPFECCTYREWTVEMPTFARRDMSDASPVIFRMNKGEKVKGLTGTVITTRAGIVRVLKNTKLGNVRLTRGDNLYLLTYLGEGMSKIWYKGRIFEDQPQDETLFKQIRRPTDIWWVKVRNRRGRIGWSREPDNFGNKDKCGR